MTKKSLTIQIVSIHDKSPTGHLLFDLVEILDSISDLVADYLWIATSIESICREIPVGIPLSTLQLLQSAKEATQLIDGTVFGFPASSVPDSIDELRIAGFPGTTATVMIVAVDSAYFEVVSKDAAIINRIQGRFKDVRQESTEHYFE